MQHESQPRPSLKAAWCAVCGVSSAQASGARDPQGRFVCTGCIDKARRVLTQRRTREALEAEQLRKEKLVTEAERDNSVVLGLRAQKHDGLVCVACGRVMPMELPLCPSCGFGDAIDALRRKGKQDLYVLPSWPRKIVWERWLPWAIALPLTIGLLLDTKLMERKNAFTGALGGRHPGHAQTAELLTVLLCVGVLSAAAWCFMPESVGGMARRAGGRARNACLAGLGIAAIGLLVWAGKPGKPTAIAAGVCATLFALIVARFIAVRVGDALVRRLGLLAFVCITLIVARRLGHV